MKIKLLFGFILWSICCHSQTVSDIDGNGYDTVQIGTQIWLKENLKTTRFSNGDIIPNISSSSDWYNMSSTISYMYCNYNNDTITANIYGRLYSWNTLLDYRGLCPNGFHVPDTADWSVLINGLGGITVAGGKLKEIGTSHWFSPNTGATNYSGFTALAGGYRYYSGVYEYKGKESAFWSSILTGSGYAYVVYLDSDASAVTRTTLYPTGALSVRCVANPAYLGLEQRTSKNHSLNIFPNPASQSISLISNETILGYRIINILGEIIVNRKMIESYNEVEVSFLSPGMYIIVAETESGNIVQKFFKK